MFKGFIDEALGSRAVGKQDGAGLGKEERGISDKASFSFSPVGTSAISSFRVIVLRWRMGHGQWFCISAWAMRLQHGLIYR